MPLCAAAAAAAAVCKDNRVNGIYACENPTTLQTMLRGHFNFSGFVVSDWSVDQHALHGHVLAMLLK